MLTNSSLPIVPVANDATSYYVSLQAISSGKSVSDFVSQALKYNSQTNQLERVNIPWVPDWKGEIIENMNLLVIYEQGIGDNIMYYRFIIELSNK